jgi:CDP-diglyceride synthetase
MALHYARLRSGTPRWYCGKFSELQFIATNMPGEKESSDAWIYLLAIAFGLIAGSVQVKFGDLLLTALVVMAFTMFLGTLRPQRPWRWMLIVAVLVLMSQSGAYFFFAQRSSREQVSESMLGFLTGTVGAYAGSLFRHALAVLTKRE